MAHFFLGGTNFNQLNIRINNLHKDIRQAIYIE
jgi:hypothetical protein